MSSVLELNDPVRAKLERNQLIGPLDPDRFFPTIDAAVDAFRRKTGAHWTSPMDASAEPPELGGHAGDDRAGSRVAAQRRIRQRRP